MHGTGTRAVISLSALSASALSTVNASRVTAGPAKLALDLERVMMEGGDRQHLGVHQQHQSLASQILPLPSSAPQQVYPAFPRVTVRLLTAR